MTPAAVSIALVTKNGARTLPALLDAIARQRIAGRVEVVAVDSGSADESPALLRDRVDRFISIPPAAFNHGLTRNQAIEQTSASCVVLLAQDAIPQSDCWLEELTRPLREDHSVAGTFARQVPRPNASAITRHYLSAWVAHGATPRRVSLSGTCELNALASIERVRCCAFDNVCSCVRRSVWERHPFPAVPIAEDLEWSRDVLVAGHAIAYVPTAVVVHSHDRPVMYELARTYLLHRRLFEVFGLRTIPDVPHLARAIASTLPVHLRCLRTAPADAPRGPRETVRALGLAVAWPLGQYLGGLSAARRWREWRLGEV